MPFCRFVIRLASGTRIHVDAPGQLGRFDDEKVQFTDARGRWRWIRIAYRAHRPSSLKTSRHFRRLPISNTMPGPRAPAAPRIRKPRKSPGRSRMGNHRQFREYGILFAVFGVALYNGEFA
jgi:hypothetical protein